MTDYARWNAMQFDDSDEENEAPRPAAPPPPAAAADAATVIERLERAERLGEEVMAERRQMIELDRQRNANREALAALRRMDREAQNAGAEVPQKHWMCMGDTFLRRPHATTRQLLEEEQKRIDREIETLRMSVKRKISTLCDLDPSITGGSDIHRSFRDLHGRSASAIEEEGALE